MWIWTKPFSPNLWVVLVMSLVFSSQLVFFLEKDSPHEGVRHEGGGGLLQTSCWRSGRGPGMRRSHSLEAEPFLCFVVTCAAHLQNDFSSWRARSGNDYSSWPLAHGLYHSFFISAVGLVSTGADYTPTTSSGL